MEYILILFLLIGVVSVVWLMINDRKVYLSMYTIAKGFLSKASGCTVSDNQCFSKAKRNALFEYSGIMLSDTDTLNDVLRGKVSAFYTPGANMVAEVSFTHLCDVKKVEIKPIEGASKSGAVKIYLNTVHHG